MATEGLVWIYTMAVTGIILMHTSSTNAQIQQISDPCNNYKEINDDWRDVTNTAGGKCDDKLTVGWYRFYIGGQKAIIPTTCLKPGVCDTALGLWIDLKGRPMPLERQTLTARACASYSVLNHWSCCALQQKVRIHHCPGNFYIYELTPVDRCPVGYCAVKNTTDVEYSVTVHHGRHIAYVETTTVPEITTQPIETTEATDATTALYQDDTTMKMDLKRLLPTQEAEMNETELNTEEQMQMDGTTESAIDKEEDIMGQVISSGSDELYDTPTPPPFDLTTSGGAVVKDKSTTIQSVSTRATTTVDIHHPGQRYAELIFHLNGHDKKDVLANFHANFTAAMQRANRKIHNITVKEIYTIGDSIKILFSAYDKNGKIIPGFKVQEDMEMRKKVEEALGLRPHPKRQDIFQEYLALFIILIIIGFLCLIILLSSCMYLYCRRHSGHWDRALAEQYHVTVVPRREARIAESPFSDEAIMSDEILEKTNSSSLGSHYPGVGNLHDLSYPNSLSGIKALNHKNSFNAYPNNYGSLPKDGIEGLVVPIDEMKPEKDALIIEDTVL